LFPLDATGWYVSLRNTEGEEVALIDDPSGLDAASREALAATLAHVRFVLTSNESYPSSR
jgi:hypothetical protein